MRQPELAQHPVQQHRDRDEDRGVHQVVAHRLDAEEAVQNGLIDDLSGAHPQVRVDAELLANQPEKRPVLCGGEDPGESPVVRVEAQPADVQNPRQGDDRGEEEAVTGSVRQATLCEDAKGPVVGAHSRHRTVPVTRPGARQGRAPLPDLPSQPVITTPGPVGRPSMYWSRAARRSRPWRWPAPLLLPVTLLGEVALQR